MRIGLIALALCAAWYYFADTSSRLGSRLLNNVEDTTIALWSALPKPGKRAEKELVAERQRSETLESELFQLRKELSRAADEAISRAKVLQDAQASSKAYGEAQAATVAHAEALGSQLAATRQNATRQAQILQKQVDDAETRAAALSHDNGILQDRLNGAAAEIAASEKARSSLQGELRDAVQEFRQQQEQSRSLASDMDHLRQTSSSQIADLREQLAQAKTVSSTKAEPTGTSPEGSPPDSHESDVPAQAAPGSSEPIVTESIPKLARDTLVEGVRTHVVVRFSSFNPSAKARALKLCSTLQAQGMLIEQIVGVPTTLQADSLVYFYKNDQSRAASIATLFPELRSTMRQRSLEGRIPRPGLIEIEVAA